MVKLYVLKFQMKQCFKTAWRKESKRTVQKKICLACRVRAKDKYLQITYSTIATTEQNPSVKNSTVFDKIFRIAVDGFSTI